MTRAVERSSLDGVTVLRTDAPAAGLHAAALTFRVGRFDETLPTSGLTHMVEHLTLAGKHGATYSFHATVTGRFTTFSMESGDPADIADYMTAVCAGLVGDQGAILDRERRILRTEAASRGSAGALGTCLAERYGATGPGLVNYQEFGLHHLGWHEVAAWRQRWFTSGNAALWIAGDVPDGLRIGLPAGPALPRQVLRPLGLTLPGYVTAGRGGIGMSLVAERGVASRAAMEILQRRLTQVLRHEHGVSYGVQVTTEDLDRDFVHAWLAADALPEQTGMAGHAMLSTFDSLAKDGCSQEEIADYVRRLRDGHASPAGPVLALQRRARDILSGRPEQHPEQSAQMSSTLRPEDIAAAASSLYAGMVVAAPGIVPAVQGRMGRLPSWSARTVGGSQRTAVDSPAVLTVGEQGVMLADEPGRNVTVPYDSVAALICWNDGKQALVGADGFAIQLDPGQWPDGPAVLAAVGARISPEAVVRVDAPGPGRPRREAGSGAPRRGAPPGAGAPSPGTGVPGRHAATGGRPRRRNPRAVRARVAQACWTGILIFGLLAIGGGDVSGGIAFAVIGVAGVVFQQYL